MTSGLLALLLCVGAPGDDSTSQPSAAAPRAFHEINDDLRRYMRLEATSQDDWQWAHSVQQMCRLYAELMQDERLLSSPTLESYRIKLRSRLMKVERDLEREMARTGTADSARTPESTAAQIHLNRTMIATLAVGGQSLGGPAQLLGYGGPALGGGLGGAPRRGDFGPDLVELIQRTISPEFWDVNGGPGTIVYYPQWFALVVRATAEVHEKIGGVVGGLRK